MKKFQEYPKMKNSNIEWIGDIPDHWDLPLLRHVTTSIKDGTHGSFTRLGNGIPLLSAKNINNGTVIISENESLISYEDFIAITANGNLQKGDVLLTIVG